MGNRMILGTLIILLIIGIGAFVFLTGNENSDTTTTPTDNTLPGTDGNSQVPPVAGSGVITAQQLALHNSQSDCWVLYKGKVYDITSFLPNHPGTPAKIAPYCGNQGFEQAFQKQHGTSKASMFMRVTQYEGDFA